MCVCVIVSFTQKYRFCCSQWTGTILIQHLAFIVAPTPHAFITISISDLYDVGSVERIDGYGYIPIPIPNRFRFSLPKETTKCPAGDLFVLFVENILIEWQKCLDATSVSGCHKCQVSFRRHRHLQQRNRKRKDVLVIFFVHSLGEFIYLVGKRKLMRKCLRGDCIWLDFKVFFSVFQLFQPLRTHRDTLRTKTIIYQVTVSPQAVWK